MKANRQGTGRAARRRGPIQSSLSPIDKERLRAKATDELLRLIVGKSELDYRRAVHNTEPRPFMLSTQALATVIRQPDDDPTEPEEQRFARALMAFGACGVADVMGLKWDYVLAGLVRLASGQRLGTREEIDTLRRKRA